jgi:hypothetical protein
MMKSRGVAVIGAFVLIVVAIFIRGLLVDDDGGGGSDGTKTDDGGGLPVVACTPDLIAVCDELAADGRIADDPPELDLSGAAKPPSEVDAWITWSPAPAIANFAAGQPKVWEDPTVLASATEGVLIDQGSLDALPASCRSKATWACLADASPELSVGVGDPRSSEGIARLAPLARTFASDDDFSTLDTDGLRDLIASPPNGQADATTLAERLTTQVGSLSMTTGPEKVLARQVRTPGGQQRRLRVLTPSPASRLVVVLTERAGRTGTADGIDCDDPPDALTNALQKAGTTACEGRIDDALAGFLFQVQKKVG